MVNGTFYWSLDGNEIGCGDLTVPIPDTGTHILELIAINESGCESSIKKILQVNVCELIYIPNSFTPNGDGLNETFGPVTNTKNWILTIYDQWGQIIYTGYEFWKGNNISDLYAYKLEYTVNHQHKEIIGRVKLLL